jgi:hypothetical protein
MRKLFAWIALALIVGADNAGTVLANADLGAQGRQCFIPFAATIVEVEVADDHAGTPNVIPGKNHAGSISNLVSSDWPRPHLAGLPARTREARRGWTERQHVPARCKPRFSWRLLARHLHQCGKQLHSLAADGVQRRFHLAASADPPETCPGPCGRANKKWG